MRKGTRFPAHYQVSRSLREAIEEGRWQPGERLPSEHELMERYGVSRNTIRRALQSLAAGNVVQRQQGSGTFVSPRGFSHALGDLRGFSQLLAERGSPPSLVDVEVVEDPMPPVEAERFLRDERPWRVTRVQTVDGEAVAVSDSWVPEEVGVKLDPSVLQERVSLYALLREDLGITLSEASEAVRAENAGRRDARVLGVREDLALITIYRWTVDLRGAPIEYARSAAPGHRHEYMVKLQA